MGRSAGLARQLGWLLALLPPLVLPPSLTPQPAVASAMAAVAKPQLVAVAQPLKGSVAQLLTAAVAKPQLVAVAQPYPAAVAQPLLAAGNPKLDPAVYPPPDTFRSMQLALLACGRENTAALCEQVRQQADPLLDHPRLPSACKDVLWNIRQKAVVGAADDFSRRDRIEKLAREVSPICSPQAKPRSNSEGSGSGSGPGQRGGIRFNTPSTR